MSSQFVQDLQELFDQTVQIAPVSSRNTSGKPTYGSAVSYPARLAGLSNMVFRTLTGNVIVGAASTLYHPILVNTTDVIAPESQLTLPDGSHPPILAVHVVHEETIPCYTVLLIGK